MQNEKCKMQKSELIDCIFHFALIILHSSISFCSLCLCGEIMRIAEIYRSVQGEVLHRAVPSVFVRARRCNLRCWVCDTPYTPWRPEGHDMSTDEIVAQVEEWDTQHVVVTGGEPMLFAELIPLCERLRAIGGHVTIETA